MTVPCSSHVQVQVQAVWSAVCQPCAESFRMASKSKARCVCKAALIKCPSFTTTHQTARSSSASSQPHKRASSTRRSVFGQVPSLPPSSMIHEVRPSVPTMSLLLFVLSCPCPCPVLSHPTVDITSLKGLNGLLFTPPPPLPSRARACVSPSCPCFYPFRPFLEGGGVWCACARVSSCPHYLPSDMTSLRVCCMYAYVRSKRIDRFSFFFSFYFFRSATKSAIRRRQKDEKVVALLYY